MSDSPLRVWRTHEGRLARLRLARPKANVLDAAMIAALDAALTAELGRETTLALLIDAEGPHFSFGASVEEHLPESCAAMLRGFHALLLRLLAAPVPVIFAVRGQCLGGGLELALTGTRIFAAPEAMFGQPEIRLGVFAPAASCLLPERIGQPAAEEMLLSGRSLGAEEARAAGLIQAVAADPEAAATDWFATHLADKSAAALRCAMAAARGPLIARRAGAAGRTRDALPRRADADPGRADRAAGLSRQAYPRWEHR